MGFGGAAQAMITAIKNNKRLLPKRDKFKNVPGGYGESYRLEFDYPKATQDELDEIRFKMQASDRKRNIIYIIVGVFFGIVALIAIISL